MEQHAIDKNCFRKRPCNGFYSPINQVHHVGLDLRLTEFKLTSYTAKVIYFQK